MATHAHGTRSSKLREPTHLAIPRSIMALGIPTGSEHYLLTNRLVNISPREGEAYALDAWAGS